MKHHAAYKSHCNATLTNTFSKKMLTYSAAAVMTAALLLSANASYADTYYKWQEPNGHWTYGSHPPYGVETIEVKTSSVGSTTADSEPTDSESNKSKLADKHAEQYAKYCETAMANLDALKSDAIVRRRDEKGNVVEMSEEEKTLETENAAQAVKQYCKP